MERKGKSFIILSLQKCELFLHPLHFLIKILHAYNSNIFMKLVIKNCKNKKQKNYIPLFPLNVLFSRDIRFQLFCSLHALCVMRV